MSKEKKLEAFKAAYYGEGAAIDLIGGFVDTPEDVLATMTKDEKEYVLSQPMDTKGNNALQLAAINNDQTMAELLIKNGADVNAQNATNGNTALHIAAMNGRRGLTDLLVKHHADITITNYDKKDGKDTPHTPVQVAGKTLNQMLSGVDRAVGLAEKTTQQFLTDIENKRKEAKRYVNTLNAFDKDVRDGTPRTPAKDKEIVIALNGLKDLADNFDFNNNPTAYLDKDTAALTRVLTGQKTVRKDLADRDKGYYQYGATTGSRVTGIYPYNSANLEARIESAKKASIAQAGAVPPPAAAALEAAPAAAAVEAAPVVMLDRGKLPIAYLMAKVYEKAPAVEPALLADAKGVVEGTVSRQHFHQQLLNAYDKMYPDKSGQVAQQVVDNFKQELTLAGNDNIYKQVDAAENSTIDPMVAHAASATILAPKAEETIVAAAAIQDDLTAEKVIQASKRKAAVDKLVDGIENPNPAAVAMLPEELATALDIKVEDLPGLQGDAQKAVELRAALATKLQARFRAGKIRKDINLTSATLKDVVAKSEAKEKILNGQFNECLKNNDVPGLTKLIDNNPTFSVLNPSSLIKGKLTTYRKPAIETAMANAMDEGMATGPMTNYLERLVLRDKIRLGDLSDKELGQALINIGDQLDAKGDTVVKAIDRKLPGVDKTPLHYAAENGRFMIVDDLIDRGAVDKDNPAVLEALAKDNNVSAVERLIIRNAPYASIASIPMLNDVADQKTLNPAQRMIAVMKNPKLLLKDAKDKAFHESIETRQNLQRDYKQTRKVMRDLYRGAASGASYAFDALSYAAVGAKGLAVSGATKVKEAGQYLSDNKKTIAKGVGLGFGGIIGGALGVGVVALGVVTSPVWGSAIIAYKYRPVFNSIKYTIGPVVVGLAYGASKLGHKMYEMYADRPNGKSNDKELKEQETRLKDAQNTLDTKLNHVLNDTILIPADKKVQFSDRLEAVALKEELLLKDLVKEGEGSSKGTKANLIAGEKAFQALAEERIKIFQDMNLPTNTMKEITVLSNQVNTCSEACYRTRANTAEIAMQDKARSSTLADQRENEANQRWESKYKKAFEAVNAPYKYMYNAAFGNPEQRAEKEMQASMQADRAATTEQKKFMSGMGVEPTTIDFKTPQGKKDLVARSAVVQELEALSPNESFVSNPKFANTLDKQIALVVANAKHEATEKGYVLTNENIAKIRQEETEAATHRSQMDVAKEAARALAKNAHVDVGPASEAKSVSAPSSAKDTTKKAPGKEGTERV